MSEFPISLKLTRQQARKLINGKRIQLKPDQLHNGNYSIMVDKKMNNKVKSAIRNKRGLRIELSHQQIARALEGEGFGDFMKKVKTNLKSIGKKVKDDVIKPSAKKLKQALKDEAKAYAIESLGKEKPLQSFKEGAKERSKKFIQEQALPEIRRATKEGITLSEKELENKLIESGMPEDLTRAIVTAGSIRLDNATAQELDNLETQLEGMGIIKGKHYTRRGGKISFKKIWKGIKDTAKKVHRKVLKPVLNLAEPILQPLITSGATAFGGPMAGVAANKIYDTLQGEGMRKSLKGTPQMAEKMARLRAMRKQKGGALYPIGRVGGALYPMGARAKQRGGAIKKPKAEIVKPKSDVTKQNLYVEGGYEPNPMSYTGTFLV
jgi:hypothetical protein